MAGFLSLYDQTDRVDLGGGYYVDVTRYLSDAAHEYAQSKLVDPRIESRVAQGEKGKDGEVRAVTTVVDQAAYHRELLVAAILGWNLTDRAGAPLPLPPYITPPRSGPDMANKARRDSIAALPAFATKKILKTILDNEALEGIDQEQFPEPDQGGVQST